MENCKYCGKPMTESQKRRSMCAGCKDRLAMVKEFVKQCEIIKKALGKNGD